MFQSYLTTLDSAFAGRAVDTTEENLQARIRGTLLMPCRTSSARWC